MWSNKTLVEIELINRQVIGSGNFGNIKSQLSRFPSLISSGSFRKDAVKDRLSAMVQYCKKLHDESGEWLIQLKKIEQSFTEIIDDE